jgi:signal transduction histidine kinase
MIAFCEYLLLELGHSSSVETLETLEETVEKLYLLATDNESHELMAKTLMIQAKLSLVRYETNEAVHYLHQAQNICNSHNLEEIKLQITYIEAQVQNSLYNMTSEIYDITEEPEKIKERVDELEIMDYIKNLHYQKEANEILMSDIQNIRRFNTELANIIQYNEQVPLNLDNLSRIVELTSREINVIYQTLTLSEEIGSSTYKPFFQEAKLDLMLGDLMEIYTPGFSANNIIFYTDNIPGDFTFEIDSHLLEKMIDHILLNIIKFTTRNGTANIKFVRDPVPKLVFSNDCETIPEDVIPQLTNKYFQYSHDGALVKGYGIGLTFLKMCMDLMGLEYEIISPIPGKDQGFELSISLTK